MSNRLLTSLVGRVRNADSASLLGKTRDRLRNSLQSSRLDTANVAEFEDVSEHERMLSDRVRVDTYAAGIDRHVHTGDVVLDVGTGTGILSFLSARKAAKVYALDHSAVLDIARKIGDHNGFTNIEYVRSHSREFDPPGGVDVIVHEQIGDELFEENIIENLVELRDRVLKPGGRILPSRFGLFLEPIQVKDDYSVPFIWQLDVHDIRFGFLRDDEHVQSLPRRWDIHWLHRLEVDHLLCRAGTDLRVRPHDGRARSPSGGRHRDQADCRRRSARRLLPLLRRAVRRRDRLRHVARHAHQLGEQVLSSAPPSARSRR